MAWEDFISSLDTEVSATDREMLLSAGPDPQMDHQGKYPALLRRFWQWEVSLRNELVRVRAAATARDPGPWLREGESSPETVQIAQAAIRIDSPLEAEDFLDRNRWKKIEELSAGEFFSLEWLTAYALKLKILLRRSGFDRDRGASRYDQLYDEILSRSDKEFTSGESNG